MNELFIQNHQYNEIRNQADAVLNACRTISDPKIIDTVRFSAQSRITTLFPSVTSSQKLMLEGVAEIHTAEDHQRFMKELETYLLPFPTITEKQIEKLFRNIKKLKLPDLATIDFRYVSYLSWEDISTNRMFIVYHTGEQFVGIEGRYTALNRKSVCFVCNQYTELGLLSAMTKDRPANASLDYYKSVGNYICTDGHHCNQHMTDVSALKKFIQSVTG